MQKGAAYQSISLEAAQVCGLGNVQTQTCTPAKVRFRAEALICIGHYLRLGRALCLPCRGEPQAVMMFGATCCPAPQVSVPFFGAYLESIFLAWEIGVRSSMTSRGSIRRAGSEISWSLLMARP